MLAAVYERPEVFVLCSRGGCPHTMSAITDFLDMAQDIHVIATGRCMSAAVPILAAGAKRSCTKSCRFMVHPAYIEVNGTLTIPDLDTEGSELRLITNSIYKLLSKHTKKSVKFWRDLGSKETHFSARDAKRFGLVDEIL